MIRAYLRLSPGERASARGQGNGYAFGLEAQADAIGAWCAGQSCGVDVVYRDIDVSGGAELEQRPELSRLLGELLPGDVLVVAKRDRLARDVFVDAMVSRLVQRAGASIVAADGNGNGDDAASVAFAQMLAVFAQFERAIIATRIRAALAVKRNRGEHLGPVPRGHVVGLDRKLVATPDPAIKRMAELRADGVIYAVIAATLTAEGFPTKSGRPWCASTVGDILVREGLSCSRR